jgi:hypothetical protein
VQAAFIKAEAARLGARALVPHALTVEILGAAQRLAAGRPAMDAALWRHALSLWIQDALPVDVVRRRIETFAADWPVPAMIAAASQEAAGHYVQWLVISATDVSRGA